MTLGRPVLAQTLSLHTSVPKRAAERRQTLQGLASGRWKPLSNISSLANASQAFHFIIYGHRVVY